MCTFGLPVVRTKFSNARNHQLSALTGNSILGSNISLGNNSSSIIAPLSETTTFGAYDAHVPFCHTDVIKLRYRSVCIYTYIQNITINIITSPNLVVESLP